MTYRKLFALLLTTVFAFTLVLPPLFSEEDKDKDEEWSGVVEFENKDGDGKPTVKVGVENKDGDRLLVTKKEGERPGVEVKISFSTIKKVASGIANTVSGWFDRGSGSDECDTGCSCDPCSCGPDGKSCSSGSCDD